MLRPFISVIVPIYNRAYCIERCLKSVEICLETGSFEVVLVDDGSKDTSVDVVKSFMKEKTEYRLIRLSNNMGVNNARNEAIAAAKGDWLLFLDSDDELCINSVDMKNSIINLQDYDLISFRCKNSSGKILGPNTNEPIKLSYEDFLSGQKSFETLDLIKRTDNSKNYFENSVNGFEGIGWARLLKLNKKLIILPSVGRLYHSDAHNQLMKLSLLKKSSDMARGYKIFLRENFKGLSFKYKVTCFIKFLCYSILSKFVSS